MQKKHWMCQKDGLAPKYLQQDVCWKHLGKIIHQQIYLMHFSHNLRKIKNEVDSKLHLWSKGTLLFLVNSPIERLDIIPKITITKLITININRWQNIWFIRDINSWQSWQTDWSGWKVITINFIFMGKFYLCSIRWKCFF